MVVRIDEAAPELAAALCAIYKVSRAAQTKDQRAAATVMTDRWISLAREAGWSRQQIAEAVGVRPAAISDRMRRHRLTGDPVPALCGVLAVPTAPLSPQTQEKLRRQRLIRSAEVARLVGCRPASVRYWATSRGVPYERTAGGAWRLYDRAQILAAAQRRPTEQHVGWQRRKNVGIPPQLRKPGSPTTRPIETA